jgi:hypothetical protein
MAIATLVTVVLMDQAISTGEPGPPRVSEASPIGGAATQPIGAQRTVDAPRVRVLGVLQQGNIFSAVLEVTESHVGTFREGDLIAQDWKLVEISPNFILIARREQIVRYELDLSPTANNEPVEANPRSPQVSTGQDRMQGFAAPVIREDVARENNRIFMEAVQKYHAER